jgi:hypothetical protein
MKVVEIIELWRYFGFAKFKCRTTLKGRLCFIAMAEDCSIFLPLAEVKAHIPSWKVAYKQYAKRRDNWEAKLA